MHIYIYIYICGGGGRRGCGGAVVSLSVCVVAALRAFAGGLRTRTAAQLAKDPFLGERATACPRFQTSAMNWVALPV